MLKKGRTHSRKRTFHLWVLETFHCESKFDETYLSILCQFCNVDVTYFNLIFYVKIGNCLSQNFQMSVWDVKS